MGISCILGAQKFSASSEVLAVSKRDRGMCGRAGDGSEAGRKAGSCGTVGSSIIANIAVPYS